MKKIIKISYRSSNWDKKKWKISQKNNHYLNVQGHHIVIIKQDIQFRIVINKINKDKKLEGKKIEGRKLFETIAEAKKNAFIALEYVKNLKTE